jgi:hypothetical protein
MWHRMEPTGGNCEHGNENSSSIKGQETSEVDQRLVASNGLSSLELVSHIHKVTNTN